MLLLGSVFFAGCGTRTILLRDGDPVRIRKAVKAHIWVRDSKGEWVESVAILPAGWYALSDNGR